jgi:hypothetical protein
LSESGKAAKRKTKKHFEGLNQFFFSIFLVFGAIFAFFPFCVSDNGKDDGWN